MYLLQSNRCSSAYYLAGYAVELALKARIAGLFQPDAIPDLAFVKAIYTHRFDTLISSAGLKSELAAAAQADPQLGAYFAIASNWSEESRYVLWDPFAAASLVEAVTEPTHGVFQWIKARW
ncbi:MAG: hypothetical protein M9915_08280 [Rhizobacter sp.]|nr:hypothetical protein [Rhizobacter sp.]